MIVFCHLLNDNSGSPTVLKETLRALGAGRHGDLLYIGSQGRGVLETTEVPPRRYWYRRSSKRLITLFTYFTSQLALYRALSRARDIPKDAVVFVNTLLPFGAALWGKRTGRPVVIHVHEVSISPAPLRWFLKKCAAKSADRLLYVSRDHQRRMPIEGPPAEVILNSVSAKISDQASPYTPRTSGTFNVLMLSSLRGYKGIEEFMSLSKRLSDRGDITFTLVLNAEAAEVESFGQNHGDVSNVSLHARTDDPAAFYETADLVLNLSRVDQWIETFGLTVVEAMTFGIPVITPPVGGPAEIVTHGREGYCIDSRDLEALRNAVLALADDPEHAMRMSRAARGRAADFTFAEYSRQIRAILAPFCPDRKLS